MGIPSSTQCFVKFVRADRGPYGPDCKTTSNESEFTSDAAITTKGAVNLTNASGKLIVGDFQATLTDKIPKKSINFEGKLSGLDEQVGSKGFN